MDRDQAKKWLPEITAFAEGKTIQERIVGNTTWRDTSNPYFADISYEFRIKRTPEVLYRVYDKRGSLLGTYTLQSTGWNTEEELLQEVRNRGDYVEGSYIMKFVEAEDV
jgi:hypothetical protein